MSSETCNDDGQSLRYGLSPEDIDALEQERRDLVEWLVRTPDGRSIIKRVVSRYRWTRSGPHRGDRRSRSRGSR